MKTCPSNPTARSHSGENAVSITKRTPFAIQLAICVLAILVTTQPARAATSGLPWEAPLLAIATSIAGPVAQSILIIAIVLLGFALAFSEGPILRRALGVVLGVTIAATAASFALNFLGFTTGATF